MPYSTGLRTPLSNFEAGENRKDASDPAISVSSRPCLLHHSCLLSACCMSKTSSRGLRTRCPVLAGKIRDYVLLKSDPVRCDTPASY